MAAKRRRAAARTKTKSTRSPIKRAISWFVFRAGLMLIVAVLCYVAWLDIQVRSQFEGRRWQVPARIFGRATELYAGAPVGAPSVIKQLILAGYHEDAKLSRPASYRRRGAELELRTRRFQFWDGVERERRVKLRFSANRVENVAGSGDDAGLLRLEPALIGRVHPTHGEDRILVRLDDVPQALVDALLASEDRQYFEHHGISMRGIARAAWANIRAAGTVQGGSTLTQQLAKSYFLTAERSLWRKLNDISIALILEARYSKDEILTAYLNEVYLGQDGPRAVHGFGLAAQHYFGRRVSELRVHEVALLAGIVKGPSRYNPRRHPQRALQRRNLVVEQMRILDMITDKQAVQFSAKALGVSARPGDANTRNPGFLDLVRRQLRRDYRDEDLRSDGLRIFTALDPAVQQAAQNALAKTLTRIEAKRTAGARGLQGAVVVTEPQSAEVLALVSGRNAQRGGFNRALDAQRPIGSLIKPVVYVTALAQPERYNLTTLIDDAPITVPAAKGEPWRPSNYDGKSHGMVPLMEALARSYNLATVRLGMDVGVGEVRKTLARMGITRAINSFPSMLLGAAELSPFEVTGVYQTFASGGFQQPLRAIKAVTTADGAPLERYGLRVNEAIDPRANFLVLRAMREVFVTGTARAGRSAVPAGLAAAGKTGTTDELRDSWFAGFAGDRLAVVWVGRDDNRSAKLTGASGALRVWSTLFATSAPRELQTQAPPGIVFRSVDAASGLPLADGCEDQGGDVLPFMARALNGELSCGHPLRNAAQKSNAGPDTSLLPWPFNQTRKRTSDLPSDEQRIEDAQ
jgi:penicillin-binding protein 1B